jgi:hypothetical protein
MIQEHQNKAEPVRQKGEIYNELDLRLALLDLNKHGFDLNVDVAAKRLLVTCKKTHNRFVIECIGNNEWPVNFPSI